MLHPVDPDDDRESEDAHADPAVRAAEPVAPAEAQRRQIWGLSPPPASLGMLVTGAVAILIGATVGFWLGRRTASKPVRKLQRAASTAEAAFDLVPVAVQLLSNPIVRTQLMRLAVGQLSRRFAS